MELSPSLSPLFFIGVGLGLYRSLDLMFCKLLAGSARGSNCSIVRYSKYIVTLRKMLLEDLESTIGAEGSMDLSSSPGSSLFNLHTFYTHVKHVLWKPNGCLHVVFGASAHSW